MSTIEIKSNLFKIIENIQNEQLLQTLYDFLKSKEQTVTGKLWKSLTDEEKKEVFISFDESEDEKNLVEAKSIFKNLK